MAQTFGYPITTQLNNYSNSSWKDTDGLCHEILERKRCAFEKKKSTDRLDFRRTGLLSQDTIMVNEKLCFDKHGNRIVSVTDDNFNEKGFDLKLKLL